MTQRANFHGQNVYAYQVSDTTWELLKQEYDAGNLLLPCCGGSAVPKEHPTSGTKFFSHAPYAGRTCEWKATGALQEELVREACTVLDKLGWKVESDCWCEGVAVDIVAKNPETAKCFAFMIETGPKADRPDDALISEDAILAKSDFDKTVWLLPEQRVHQLKNTVEAISFHRTTTDAENTVGDLARSLRRWLEPVETSNSKQRTQSDVREDPLPSDEPTGIEADPEWQDGKSSVGSPSVRVDRLTRLANRWLSAKHANTWLNKVHPSISYNNSPFGAAQCAATGYLEAQNALKAEYDAFLNETSL